MEQLQNAINAISPVSPADFELLKTVTKNLTVKKHTNLLAQGETCKNVYFIKKGFFRMFYVDLNGNEVNFRFAAANNFMVNFQSFLTQKPSNYYWQAMQDAEILYFAYQDVQRLYDECPAWEHFGRLMSEHVYIQLNERVEMFQFMSPEQRYQHLLNTKPELFNQVSQFHLSSYLGVKPESLSRLRKRLLFK